MLGDWLKVEVCTPDKPEVFKLAETLALSRDEIVGKLVRLWAWFDQHISNDARVTQKQIDEIVGVVGFSDALVVVGWLKPTKNGFTVEKFERHLGKGAKTRALARDRQKTHRSRVERDNDVTRERDRERKEKADAVALPAWMQGNEKLTEAWGAWREVRSRIRAPNTPRALALALKELERLRGLGQDPQRVLEVATVKGWRGLFPVKPEEVTPPQPSVMTCKYCAKKATGKVSGIWHCGEHANDAMDGK